MSDEKRQVVRVHPLDPRVPMTEKKCGMCHAVKPLEEFHRNRRNRDGRTNYCKPCARLCTRLHHEGNAERIAQVKREYYEKNREAIAAYKREWAERNREAIAKRLRNWQLQTKYNLTLEGWEALFAKQGGVCGGCGSDDPQSKMGWHTDHCHATGRTRGILCHHCNLALGNVKDSPETLLRLHRYLSA